MVFRTTITKGFQFRLELERY